jgi:hypothetical protein
MFANIVCINLLCKVNKKVLIEKCFLLKIIVKLYILDSVVAQFKFASYLFVYVKKNNEFCLLNIDYYTIVKFCFIRKT